VGKHPIPIKRPPYPLTLQLGLEDIEGVYPPVLTMLKQFPPEPMVGLRDISDEALSDVFYFPRIAVVPIRGESKYWVWSGVRAYRRLVDRGSRGKITVLDYGPRMPEEKIVYLAEKDWLYASSISGQTHRTDWACAQEWEAHSGYICKPSDSGKRRLSGLNIFAKLHGLDPRPLRADKVS
jgi:hypothetical protein